MELSAILSADVLDIIFDGRNKEYGAYELRKTYKRRLAIAMLVNLIILIFCFTGYVLANRGNKIQVAQEILIPDNELELIKPEEKVQPPPPPLKTPPPQQVETKQFTNIIIKPDEEVKAEDKPPAMKELEDTRIGTVNQEGIKDEGIVAPPSDEAGKNGIIVEPKKPKPEEDEVLIHVQIQSSYPGGPMAWKRFLDRNLARNYPQDAIDNEVQGRVEIQFIVDTLGNVSNVQAISGPAELHQAAIKVIQKSGQWNPAIQNGRKVKSYKRQPIIFQLSQE